MSPSAPQQESKKSRGSHRAPAHRGRRWEVPGPSRAVKESKDGPDSEDYGRLVLDVLDRDSLHHQGRMLTGVTTTAFHNLICNHYFFEGVRCTESDFVPDLQVKFREDGLAHGWNEYLSLLTFRESGSYNLRWNSQKIILVQAFWGPRKSGHFATLVLDRTRQGNPIAVYADSLTDFQPHAVELLKSMLEHTPLSDYEIGWTWIKASVPRQGIATNDCGVISSCFSLLYVYGLQQAGLLDQSSSQSVQGRVQGVRLELPKSMSMFDFGCAGRSYMSKSLKHAKLDFKNAIFRAKVRWT